MADGSIDSIPGQGGVVVAGSAQPARAAPNPPQNRAGPQPRPGAAPRSPGGPGHPPPSPVRPPAMVPAMPAAKAGALVGPVVPAPGPAPRPAAAPGSAGVRPRHRAAILSFVAVVLLPLALLGWYLWGVAQDQFASVAAFSVRREEPGAALDMFGGLAGLSSGSSSDTDILYDFIRSQDMVTRIDARIDLRRLYADPAGDPVFGLPADASVERLRDHWSRVVRLSYDQGEGMIQMTVLAFSPGDAQAVAQAILEESTQMINDLSAAARADAMRNADDDLRLALDRLRRARTDLTTFRSAHQIADPSADIASQTGVLDTLNTQLAEAMIELDMLRLATGENDPRIAMRRDRIGVIERRIAEERRKFGSAAGGDYAAVLEEFERLALERDFAEKSYVAALAAADAARADAMRQSRYLAAHIRPTLAQTAEYPRRLATAALAALFLMLGWAVIVLVVWSIRDRR